MKKEKKLASTPVWFEHTLPKEMPVCFVYTIAGPVWISEGIISRVLGGLHRVNHSAKVPVVGSKTAYFIIILSLKKTWQGQGPFGTGVPRFVSCTWRWAHYSSLTSASLKALTILIQSIALLLRVTDSMLCFCFYQISLIYWANW